MRITYNIVKIRARVTDYLHNFKGLDIDDCQYPITCIRIVAFFLSSLCANPFSMRRASFTV